MESRMAHCVFCVLPVITNPDPALSLFRPGKIILSPDVYIGNSKIRKTKKASREKSISILMNAVDKREMWSLINDMRGGKKVNSPIDTSVLHDHFEKILFSPHTIPKENLDLIEKKLDTFLNKPSVSTPNQYSNNTNHSNSHLPNTNESSNEILPHPLLSPPPSTIKSLPVEPLPQAMLPSFF